MRSALKKYLDNLSQVLAHFAGRPVPEYVATEYGECIYEEHRAGCIYGVCMAMQYDEFFFNRMAFRLTLN